MSSAALTVGDEVVVTAGPIAHGGHVVARHEGRVLFVRHALPGESVRVRVTEGGDGDRFLRADAIEVLDASPDRVEPACAYAGPALCGGCDFQHVALPAQRALKAAVVREQMAHLARLEVEVHVEPMPGEVTGLGWRTRVEYAVDAAGRVGLRKHRSHDVVEIDRCLLAAPDPVQDRVIGADWSGYSGVDVVVPSVGDPVVVPLPVGERAVPDVTERIDIEYANRESRHALTADFEVSARGFWQVHPAAASTFTEMVLSRLDPLPGERALDLYAGVGLFSLALADAVGPTGQVIAVESDAQATAQAKANLAAFRQALVLSQRVDDAFGVPRATGRGPQRRRGSRPRKVSRSPQLPTRADLVVLDPPRTGAGRGVCQAVAELRPRAVVYVACDPAALARDTAYLAQAGYRLQELRAFDAFPMTHHVECVAHFTRDPNFPA